MGENIEVCRDWPSSARDYLETSVKFGPESWPNSSLRLDAWVWYAMDAPNNAYCRPLIDS